MAIVLTREYVQVGSNKFPLFTERTKTEDKYSPGKRDDFVGMGEGRIIYVLLHPYMGEPAQVRMAELVQMLEAEGIRIRNAGGLDNHYEAEESMASFRVPKRVKVINPRAQHSDE